MVSLSVRVRLWELFVSRAGCMIKRAEIDVRRWVLLLTHMHWYRQLAIGAIAHICVFKLPDGLGCGFRSTIIVHSQTYVLGFHRGMRSSFAADRVPPLGPIRHLGSDVTVIGTAPHS